MAAPTREALETWADHYVALSNKGEKEAWGMENIFSKDGNKQHMLSIEVYRFGDDGSVEIRTHYDVPDASDPISGEIFANCLPD